MDLNDSQKLEELEQRFKLEQYKMRHWDRIALYQLRRKKRLEGSGDGPTKREENSRPAVPTPGRDQH